MSADKHPAEVLADKQERLEFDEPHSTADMLRRIPALEAERDQLRAEVEALREANSTFATAAILPDDKVIVDKAEIEALRADAERYAWVRTADCFTLERMIYRSNTPDEFDAAVDAARKQQ